jgi:hypothetical protein
MGNGESMPFSIPVAENGCLICGVKPMYTHHSDCRWLHEVGHQRQRIHDASTGKKIDLTQEGAMGLLIEERARKAFDGAMARTMDAARTLADVTVAKHGVRNQGSVFAQQPVPTPQLGWECPRCHLVHAPFVRVCECKP